LALIILLLAIAVGWLVWRWFNPQLKPVNVQSYPEAQFIYSANGYGYPVIEYTGSYDNEDYQLYRLDDLGNRLPGLLQLDCLSCEDPTEVLAVSPTRKILACYVGDRYTGKGMLVYTWKDGQTRRVPCKKGVGSPQISDDGLMHWDHESFSKYRTVDGRLVAPQLSPATGWRNADGIGSLDPNLLPLLRGKNLYIYNLTSKRIDVKFPTVLQEEDWYRGLVLRHGTCIAAIPSEGSAMVWNGTAMTSLPAKETTRWLWGEDGSVWTYSGDQLSVLHWRQSAPRLERLPYSSVFDQVIGNSTENAVWGDGEFIAHTDWLDRRTPTAMVETVRAIFDRINWSLPEMPTMSLQLSLYHRTRLLGRFRVPIFDNVSYTLSHYPGNKYSEHLAFTADGRYLSWVVDSGDGTHLYVFPTGR